jgi:hypothetical protein
LAKNAPNLAIPRCNSHDKQCVPYFFKLNILIQPVLKIKNKATCSVPCLIRTAQKITRSEIHKKWL